MKELKDYYKKCKRNIRMLLVPTWLFLYIISSYLNDILSVFLNKCAINEIGIITQENLLIFNLILDVLLDFIAPTTIIVSVYGLLLRYIDKKAWKKKYPQFDISGKWNDTTYYTRYLDANGLSVINREHKASSPVIIEQTCHKVSIQDSIGKSFKWYSILCDWNSNNLDILYAVEYYSSLQEKGYSEKRYGYECMCIDTKEMNNTEKPSRMVGKFWHCCSSDGKPVYMGDVVYER